MDTPATPPPQNVSPSQPPKKGLGTGAKVGIGCGVVALIALVLLVVFSVAVGGKLKKIGETAQNNPTRATAEAIILMGGEMIAEDDVAKRYTVKGPDGKLITFYWNERTNSPEQVSGDFSAIPANPTVLPEAPEATAPAPDTE